MGWLQANLSFKLLCSVNICIRRFQSKKRERNEKKNNADDSSDKEYVYDISINKE